ncbi:MAG: LysR family transcriptional regulator [Pseudomonadota bacterium]
MKPSPYQIMSFTHVARARSFSRAAEQLGVTQSSVTQHIAKLEKNMGTLLFVRRRDGVELTQTARELFALSDRMRTLEELITEKVASYGDLSSGHLRIIANAPRPAMPLVAEYTRRYPGIEIYFSLHDWTTAMELLRDREVDIGVVTEPRPIEGEFICELGRSPYMAYIRRDHPLAGQGVLSLQDLSETLVILPEDGSFTQRVVAQKCAELGMPLTRTMKTRSSPVLKEAVLHGVGIGLFLDDSMFPSQSLVALPIREMPETYGHYLVTPRDKQNLRLIRSFAELADSD